MSSTCSMLKSNFYWNSSALPLNLSSESAIDPVTSELIFHQLYEMKPRMWIIKRLAYDSSISCILADHPGNFSSQGEVLVFRSRLHILPSPAMVIDLTIKNRNMVPQGKWLMVSRKRIRLVMIWRVADLTYDDDARIFSTTFTQNFLSFPKMFLKFTSAFS